MCYGRDVQDFGELKRQGLNIRAISRLTGYCRKTVRKYLIHPDAVPAYGPRAKQPGKLDPFKPYLEDRMRAPVAPPSLLVAAGDQEDSWNANAPGSSCSPPATTRSELQAGVRW